MADHRYFEIKTTIESTHEPRSVSFVGTLKDMEVLEIKGTDGVWYRFPKNAEMKEVVPLKSGYYIMNDVAFTYRVLLEPTLFQYWDGSTWNSSADYTAGNVEEFQKNSTYIGPLDMSTLER